MLKKFGAKKFLQAEAVNMESYIGNRCITTAVGNEILYIAWTGKEQLLISARLS